MSSKHSVESVSRQTPGVQVRGYRNLGRFDLGDGTYSLVEGIVEIPQEVLDEMARNAQSEQKPKVEHLAELPEKRGLIAKLFKRK